jgi:parallel beta-helix repeat protein
MSPRSMRRARERELRREAKRQERLTKRQRATAGAGAAVTATVLSGAVLAPGASAATYTVTSLADDNTDGTLRYEVQQANTNLGPDDVVFQPGLTGKINLYEGHIPINDPVNIQGPGAGVITVDANEDGNQSRHFYITAGSEFPTTISGLTLTDGFVQGGAGGSIYSDYTDLTLAGMVLTDNEAKYQEDNGFPNGVGGAIFVDGGPEQYSQSLTVQNSRITHNDAGLHGGGIYVGDTGEVESGNAVTISGTTIRGNEAGFTVQQKYFDFGTPFFATFGVGSGGGVHLDSPDGPVVINPSTISHNRAYFSGGGISIRETEEAIVEENPVGAPVTIDQTAITDNEAGSQVTKYFTTDGGAAFEVPYGPGGGIYLYDIGAPLLVQSSDVSGNEAASAGGGIYLYDTDSESSFTVADSTVNNNKVANFDLVPNDVEQAFNHGGGGMFLYGPDDPMLIEDTTIAGNTAAGSNGGGIYLYDNDDDTTINRSTIADNSARDGGGIYLYDADDPLLFQNSTISGNEASDQGGGAYLYDTDGYVTFLHTTLASNSAAEQGGGIYLYQDNAYLDNTIVADNASPGTDLSGDGTFYLDFSLVEDPGTATTTEVTAGSNILNTDPLLGPLADNGGPTQTHALPKASPAVDKGNSFGVGEDQRTLPRPVDLGDVANSAAAGADGADMGAFELQAEPAAGPEAPGVLPGAPAVAGVTCRGQAPTVQGVNGTPGNDVILGTNDRDTIKAGGGNDLVCALDGKDIVKGASGKDKLLGQKGADKEFGAGGRDTLRGGRGADFLVGGPARDRLFGGAGQDTRKQ